MGKNFEQFACVFFVGTHKMYSEGFRFNPQKCGYLKAAHAPQIRQKAQKMTCRNE